jgi:FkbM family methyltransferase
MDILRLKGFASRSSREQVISVRFFLRHALARLPYLPLRLYLRLSEQESVGFGWSYLPASFVVNRSVFHREWLGTDTGELRFISKALQPGMTFLDIGAYHGIYSVIAAKRVGPSGRVIAFEPSKRERRILRFHSLLNPSPKIRVEPYAVGSRTGPQQFFVVVNGMQMMNSLQRPRTEALIKAVSVESITLDTYRELAGLDRIDFIKIDVEGGELPLLEGGRAAIIENRPIIICELLDWVTQPWGHTARDVAIYLEGFDYQWFEFCEDGMLKPHTVMDSYPNEVRNFLAVPREKTRQLERLNLIRARSRSAA